MTPDHKVIYQDAIQDIKSKIKLIQESAPFWKSEKLTINSYALSDDGVQVMFDFIDQDKEMYLLSI